MASKLAALEEMGLECEATEPVSFELSRLDRKTHKINCGRPAMGTLVGVTAIGRSASMLEEATGQALLEMERLIALLSRFDSSSAVSDLNSSGRMKAPPKELSLLVASSLRYHKLSRGAFDITVEPVVQLLRRAGDSSARAITDAEIADALELVGSEHIETSAGGIRFSKSGMELSLNGIAKGYIVDAMATKLRKHKVKNFLINAGGDIRTSGRKEGKRPWTVAVQDPAKSEDFPDTISLSNAAVATSGSYEKGFGGDRGFHHIVHSGTGLSPNVNVSATVVAPTAMDADALATGVFVLDPNVGIDFINSLRGCECLLIDRDGAIHKTRGWRSANHMNEKRLSQNAEAVYV